MGEAREILAEQEMISEQAQEEAQELIDVLSDELGEIWQQEEVLDPVSGRQWGKALRKIVPRTSQGEWVAFDGRPDPVALLKEQGESRIQSLLPIRYQRMSASPFTFYRGCALVMASDLSHTPCTGVDVQVCGDAHISNFGYYASPERDIVFDINDFDETTIGPWEWDIKRLVTSVYICAEDLNLPKKDAIEAVRLCSEAYRQTMIGLTDMSNLDVWYTHASTVDTMLVLTQTGMLTNKEADAKIGKIISYAAKRDNSRAVAKLTEVVDGQRRFRSDPPVLKPLRELLDEGRDRTRLQEIAEKVMSTVMKRYFDSLSPDKRHLLSQYRGCDMAHKIVGTGSVGLFDWIVLLQGCREDDYLVLQLKEAQESVVERFVGSCGIENCGQRVVQGQRAIQAASDIMLGWSYITESETPNHQRGDLYVRQLWDCKGSIDITLLTVDELKCLGQLCGMTLARAHARTGNRFLIAGYLGKSAVFDDAMVKFAAAYAKQNKKDYKRFLQAIESGELPHCEG